MKKTVQFLITFILLPFIYTTAIADDEDFDYTKEDLSGYNLQPKLKVSEEDDTYNNNSNGINYARNGHDIYFFSSYIYDYRLLSSSTLTTTQGSNSTNYVPDNVYDSSYNGFEVGVGKEWSRHIDFQILYEQILKTTRTTIAGNVTTKAYYQTNGVMGNVLYIFNPDSQFQCYVKLGAAVEDTDNHLTVGNVEYSADDHEIAVNPAAGLGLLVQFSQRFGLRLEELYTTSIYNDISNGDLSTRIGLNIMI